MYMLAPYSNPETRLDQRFRLSKPRKVLSIIEFFLKMKYTLFYTQHFYRQRQAEIGKKLS